MDSGNSPKALDSIRVVNWEALNSTILPSFSIIVKHSYPYRISHAILYYIPRTKKVTTHYSPEGTQLEAHAAILQFSHNEFSHPLPLPPMKCVGVGNQEIRKSRNLEIACDSLNS